MHVCKQKNSLSQWTASCISSKTNITAFLFFVSSWAYFYDTVRLWTVCLHGSQPSASNGLLSTSVSVWDISASQRHKATNVIEKTSLHHHHQTTRPSKSICFQFPKEISVPLENALTHLGRSFIFQYTWSFLLGPFISFYMLSTAFRIQTIWDFM